MHHSSTDDVAVSNADAELHDQGERLERESAAIIADAIERQADLTGISAGGLGFLAASSLDHAGRNLRQAIAATTVLLERGDAPAGLLTAHMALVEHAVAVGRARTHIQKLMGAL